MLYYNRFVMLLYLAVLLPTHILYIYIFIITPGGNVLAAAATLRTGGPVNTRVHLVMAAQVIVVVWSGERDGDRVLSSPTTTYASRPKPLTLHRGVLDNRVTNFYERMRPRSCPLRPCIHYYYYNIVATPSPCPKVVETSSSRYK